MEMQWQWTGSKNRDPGESRSVLVIDRPSQFDKVFDEFVASMGIFKIIGVNFKMDEPPDDGSRKSKSAGRARRRRQRRMMLKQRLAGDAFPYRQYSSMPQFDGGDNGDENDAQAEDAEEDEENDDAPSSEEGERELDEDELCEFARQRTYEVGKIALISMSSLNGYTLIIRTCRFLTFPEKLSRMLEGKEFLKIGFGIHGDKHRIYRKYQFFVLNFIDPRRPLFAWKNFVDGYHFERFGVYSVASYLFRTEMQNIDAAACLSSMWSAQELNPYLKRAAARETQLTVDVYAEMCVQTLGRRVAQFSLSSGAYTHQSFYEELMSVAEGHINSGFDMKDFGVKVFSTPALQRRFRHKLAGGKAAVAYSATNRDVIPETFADRVRLRQSKSTVEKYWKSKILYASFDVSLFEKKPSGTRSVQPITLTKEVDNVVWEMRIEVVSKMSDRVTNGPVTPLMVPAIAYYQKEEAKEVEQAPICPNAAETLGDDRQSKPQMEDAQSGNEVYWNGAEEYYEYGVEAMMLTTQATEFAGLMIDTDAVYNDAFSGPQFSPAPYPCPCPSPEPQVCARVIGRGRGRSLDASSLENVPQPPRGRGRPVKQARELPKLPPPEPPKLEYVGSGRGRGLTSTSATSFLSSAGNSPPPPGPMMMMKKSRGPRPMLTSPDHTYWGY